MRRSWLVGLAVLAAAAALVGRGALAHAADSPFSGTWKLTVLSSGQEVGVCLIQISGSADKPRAKVLAGLPRSPLEKATLENLAVKGQTVRFTLKGNDTDFQVQASARGKGQPLLGTVSVRGEIEPIQLESTEDKELDPAKAVRRMDGLKELQEAGGLKGAERLAKMKGLQEKYAGKPLGLLVSQFLLQTAAGEKAPADDLRAADRYVKDLRAAADRYVKEAAGYGPELEANAAYQVAQAVARADKASPLALEYAQKAAKLVGDGASPARTAAVLKVLARALRNAGKADEAKEVEGRLARAEDALDKEFLKTAVPFKPEAFTGRKGESTRVVLVELFTGAQCPPCVSADIAFDAALETFKPADAVFLEYHLHIPGPDPLTNADTEARMEYYGREIEGTPTMFLDGKVTDPMGGGRQHGKARYEALRKLLEKEMETAKGANLKLTVKREGDKLNLEAQVGSLKKTGDKVRLRFVLVEDVVRYPGRNGQRLHHHVVRAFPGGAKGVALTEKSATKSATVSLGELRKGLEDYLTAANKKRPFMDDERPLRLENLKVVAFIQDDEDKSVLQAAQADVPAAK
jgi:hypothetical protein